MADDIPPAIALAAKKSAERIKRNDAVDVTMAGDDASDPNSEPAEPMPEKFYKGQRVKVLYQGKWYDGEYVREKSNGQLSVQCDADPKGTLTNAKATEVDVLPLANGTSCFVKDGKEWKDATIVKVHSDGSYSAYVTAEKKKLKKLDTLLVRSCKPQKNERRAGGTGYGGGGGFGGGGGGGFFSGFGFGRRKPRPKPLTKLEDIPDWPTVAATVAAPVTPPIRVLVKSTKKNYYDELVEETTKVALGSAVPVQILNQATAVGMTVGSLWNMQTKAVYTAKVEAINSNGTFKLKFSDGDTQPQTPAHLITYKELAHDYKGAPFDLSAMLKKAMVDRTIYLFYKQSKWSATGEWTAGYYAGMVKPRTVGNFVKSDALNSIVTVWKGDITTLGVDAIQNAANSGLHDGGGICGAIHSAAGPELSEACMKIEPADDDDEAEADAADVEPAVAVVAAPAAPVVDADGIAEAPPSTGDLPSKFYAGQRVEVMYKKIWYPGTYSKKNWKRGHGVQCDEDPEGTITWAGDGIKGDEAVKVVPLAKDSACFVELNGEWHDAEITEVHADGTYTVYSKAQNMRASQCAPERVRSVKPQDDFGMGIGSYGDAWKPSKPRCPTGQTRVTAGFKLHAKYVLHTVGPTSHDEPALVKAYQSAMRAANENKFQSIALCCVSTGIFGFPNEAACPLALTTVRAWLEKNPGHSLKKVIFCLFTDLDQELYNRYMPQVFPTR